VTQGAGAASSVTPRVAERKNFDVGLMHLAVAELRGEKRCEGREEVGVRGEKRCEGREEVGVRVHMQRRCG
jgi:hypothetical protein